MLRHRIVDPASLSMKKNLEKLCSGYKMNRAGAAATPWRNKAVFMAALGEITP